jgi:RNA polymerase sigma-70 factor (ECF subfamily)
MASRRASDEIERHVRQWNGLITRTASQFGIQWTDLDDLLQDIRIRVWRAMQSPREKSGALPSSYMYSLVRSATIDFLRRRRDRRASTHLSLDSAAALPAPTELTAEGVEAVLEGALTRLSAERRVAVRLHLDGKHLRDIAQLLDWSEGKTRNLLYRGLEDLKLMLQDSSDEEEGRE